jgi:hypothetical protein
MIFLGTPFLGSSAAKEAHWAVVVGGIMGEQTSNQLVQDLEQKHDFVRQRVHKFTQIANDDSVRLPLRCFYETRKTQMLSRVLPRPWVAGLSPRFTQKIVRYL